MPAYGGSRGVPLGLFPASENQSVVPQLPAAAPAPTGAYSGGYAPASNPNTPSATIPYSAGVQYQGGQPLSGYAGMPAWGQQPWGAGQAPIGTSQPMSADWMGTPQPPNGPMSADYQAAYGQQLGQNQSAYNSIRGGMTSQGSNPNMPVLYGATGQNSPSTPLQNPGGYYNIGGALPWNNAGANMFQGMNGTPQEMLSALGNNYANAYNSALNMNQTNYNNILAGYQQTAGNQLLAQQGVVGGYNNLSNDVLGGIAGIGSDQLALINRNYAAQSGNADQNLINSGLGNSTVRSSVQRGIGLDQNLAQNNLANSIAQTKAGFQSNIGLAGLGYQGQSVRDNTGLALDQLHWMNSVNAGYPDAAMYGNLAQQAGAAIQSGLNRDQIDRLAAEQAASGTDLGAQIRQAAVQGGQGGGSTAPYVRQTSSLPYNTGGTPGAPGMGTSGSSQGSFASSGYGAPGGVGTGGGGSMQQALGGGRSVPFGSGLLSAPGVSNVQLGAGAFGGVQAGLAAGGQFGGYATAADQYNAQAAIAGQQAAAAAAYAAQLGGYGGGEDYWGNTTPELSSGYDAGAFGSGAAGGAAYGMWPNAFPGDAMDFGQGGFGGAFDALGSGINWGGYTEAAQDFGAGAFGGVDYGNYGGGYSDAAYGLGSDIFGGFSDWSL